jgi:glycine cleavage system H lipoate-binding protein
VNDDPYGEGWLCKVRLDDPESKGDLMPGDEYRKLLEEL